MMNGGEIFDAGDAASVLTPEKIKHVYDVEVEVKNHGGRPYIVPIRPANSSE